MGTYQVRIIIVRKREKVMEEGTVRLLRLVPCSGNNDNRWIISVPDLKHVRDLTASHSELWEASQWWSVEAAKTQTYPWAVLHAICTVWAVIYKVRRFDLFRPFQATVRYIFRRPAADPGSAPCTQDEEVTVVGTDATPLGRIRTGRAERPMKTHTLE